MKRCWMRKREKRLRKVIMSKKESELPVAIVWWKLITALVMFTIAILTVILIINSYMKTLPD